MSVVARRFRTRLFPALITALGVGLLASGLLSYTTAVEPGVAVLPLASYNPLPTLDPAHLPGGNLALPSGFPADRVATRVVVPRLGIDLPVMLQTAQYGNYPLCDVAMYLPEFGQPGEGRATYIYAHAQPLMFLPLFIASQTRNGARMIGDLVEVYTSDNYRFVYSISEVHSHVYDLNDAFTRSYEVLFLQTSEGPHGTTGKLQVVATYVSQDKVDPQQAHPNAKPRICGYS